MIAGMLNRGTVKDSKQNRKMSQENRRGRTPVRSRKRTAIPTIGSGDTKRDMTVSSFMLALVLVGVVVVPKNGKNENKLRIAP
jgi:hypothetical protein